MLLRSSKRAFSSTSTATCLPPSAASISSGISGEFGADAVQRHLDRDDVRILHRGAQERFDRAERLERVVDEDVLIAQLVEDDLRILVRAPRRCCGENGGSFSSGRWMRVSCIQSPNPTRSLRPHDDVVGDLEVLDQDVEHARRHVRFDLQQRDRAVAQLLQAAVDRLEQIVRFVLLDLQVGVAHDAEQVRALHLRAGKQLLDVGADDVLEEHERQPGCRLSASGIGMNRGSTSGTFTRANFVRLPCRTTTAKFLLRFEMSGNGWPGSNASGVRTGQISREK